MRIEILLAMIPSHRACAARGMVEGTPQGLDDLTIHLAGTFDKGGSKLRIALFNMTMDVEETDTPLYCHVSRNIQVTSRVANAIEEVDPELAHDIVQHENEENSGYIVYGIDECIVHISVPTGVY